MCLIYDEFATNELKKTPSTVTRYKVLGCIPNHGDAYMFFSPIQNSYFWKVGVNFALGFLHVRPDLGLLTVQEGIHVLKTREDAELYARQVRGTYVLSTHGGSVIVVEVKCDIADLIGAGRTMSVGGSVASEAYTKVTVEKLEYVPDLRREDHVI